MSAAQAEDNLAREAGDGFDFEALKAAARAAWMKQLRRSLFEASDDVKTIFYTAITLAALPARDRRIRPVLFGLR